MRTPSRSPLRDRFVLEPDVTFLNHGSYGACPRPVLAAQTALRDALEANPVRFLARELPGRIDAAREESAQFVGADPRDLVFVSNATSGVNAVLRSRTFAPGDVVLTTSHDYVGCRSALLEIASRAGLRVRIVHLPFPVADEDEFIERVLEQADGDVKLAMLDHVASSTGLVMPIERLVPALEARGIEVLVDAAHSVGMLPLSLDALGASYYTTNAHKWLCAPKGAALLHVRRDRQDGLVPGTISMGTRFPRASRVPFHERFDWVGTLDPTPWLVLPDCIRFLSNALPGGIDATFAHNRQLALEARQLLCDALEVEPPAPDRMIGSLAAIPLLGRFAALADRDAPPDAAQSPLVRRLADDFHIEVPILRVEGAWVLRVAAQLYNSLDEYRYLAEVLRGLAG